MPKQLIITAEEARKLGRRNTRKDFDGSSKIFQILKFTFPNENVVREFYFAKPRMYRADVALPDRKLLLEYDGMTYAKTKAGHSTGPALENDRRRDIIAILAGYTTLRFTEKMVKEPGYVKDVILQLLERAT